MLNHGFLTIYAKLRVAHAPGMPGTFSLPPTSKENASQRSRHASRHVRDARAVMHVGIAIPRWRGKRSRHFRRMRKTQFYVCGKRPMYNLLDNATNGHNTGSMSYLPEQGVNSPYLQKECLLTYRMRIHTNVRKCMCLCMRVRTYVHEYTYIWWTLNVWVPRYNHRYSYV